MSLTIRIKAAYYKSESSEVCVNLCKYKLIYGNVRKNFHVKLGTILSTEGKNLARYLTSGTSSNGTNEDHLLMTSIFNESGSSGSSKKIVYYFKDGNLLEYGDYLEIYCYRNNKKFRRYINLTMRYLYLRKQTKYKLNNKI